MFDVIDRTKQIELKAGKGDDFNKYEGQGKLHEVILRTSSDTVEGFLEVDGQHFPFNIIEQNADGLTSENRIFDWRLPRYNSGSACCLSFTPPQPMPFDKNYKLHISNIGAANITINHIRIVREIPKKER